MHDNLLKMSVLDLMKDGNPWTSMDVKNYLPKQYELNRVRAVLVELIEDEKVVSIDGRFQLKAYKSKVDLIENLMGVCWDGWNEEELLEAFHAVTEDDVYEFLDRCQVECEGNSCNEEDENELKEDEY